MRAERRLGELIVLQKESVGLAQGRRSDLLPSGKEVDKPTLKEAGIDHKLSSRAQKLAAVPEDKFESMAVPYKRTRRTSARFTSAIGV